MIGAKHRYCRAMPEKTVHETAVPLVKIPAVAEGPAEPVAPVERRRAPSGRVYTPGELPADVRSGLPEFRISGHAYSPEAQTTGRKDQREDPSGRAGSITRAEAGRDSSHRRDPELSRVPLPRRHQPGAIVSTRRSGRAAESPLRHLYCQG